MQNLRTNSKRFLITIFNKMTRFITKSGSRSHVGQTERSQIGYLSVDDRFKFPLLCHAQRYI